MTLQDRLDAHKKDFLSKAPPEAVAVMQQATEDLKNSGILEKSIREGQQAPDFTLYNTAGETVSLSAPLKRGPVVLGFYRGRW